MRQIIHKLYFLRQNGWLAAGLLAVATVINIPILVRATPANGDNRTKVSRLITIYDRGQKISLLSKAAIVGGAIKEAGIDLSSGDKTEPGIGEKLVAQDYQINIYRAVPILIEDGSTRKIVYTASKTTENILQDAQLDYYPEDELVLLPNDNFALDGAILKLEINRATPFSLTLYGKKIAARSCAKDIDGFLKDRGINLAKADKLSLPIKTKITKGMDLRIWREGKQTISIDEPIKFQTEIIEDNARFMSYRQVQKAGVDGLRHVSYEITIQDGKEVSRVEITSYTIRQPVNEVLVVGVKGKYTTPSENQTITWNYLIDQGFSPVQTAGIMGNLMQEHRFRTDGDGIAQWTGGRKAALYSRPEPNNIYTQLDFLMYELNTGYAYVRDNIKRSDNLVEVVRIFQNQFERCGICRESSRIEYARDILATHNP